jgi:OmpA-OmpF porin, OOP family
MRLRHLFPGATGLVVATVLFTSEALAQGGLLGRVKRRVEDNVGRKAEQLVDCAMGDQACMDKAKADGKAVRIDSTRTAPRTTDTASAASRSGSGARSGDQAAGDATDVGAVWANYDFVPGTKTFFVEDFSNDAVGNFPQRYEFQNGNIELVTNRERRWLRFESAGKMFIPLPGALPPRYTIEMDYWGESADACWLYPSGDMSTKYRIEFGAAAYGSVQTPAGKSSSRYESKRVGEIHVGRIAVDGNYAKVYVNEHRVANVPNFADVHGSKIGFWCDGGMALGGIRIAEGGRKLYDALEADGRVATQGIYFDTGSDRIRPESTPTLKEIAAMLSEHAGLRLRIEGHTDNVGAAAANLDLSKRRAEAVKAYLSTAMQVDGSRLEASGLGSSTPAMPNTTPEGRQTNRRVELVKLP